jgi:hypothetical protein
MKIYILPVADSVRPAAGFVAPAHNQDYGAENDFENWINQHSEYLTDDPSEADFDLFQPLWNRYYCNYWGDKTDVLQAEILRCVSRNRPTFTICEYGIKTMQPGLDLCGMAIFCASRHEDDGSIDIPLLCSPHNVPPTRPRHWLASFMGKFETHGIREEMRQAVNDREDIYLSTGQGTAAYADLMANSLVALAPRGYGGQSFRFYEAMQFGTAPFLIGDIDTRPFKHWLNWDECSLYTDDAGRITEILDSCDPGTLRQMGDNARRLWRDEVHYGKWCKYVIHELDGIKQAR